MTRHTLLLLCATLLAAIVAATAGVAAGVGGGPPAGSQFSGPVVVGAAGTMAASTSGASVQTGEPGVVHGDHAIWFAWTATRTGPAYVVAAGRSVPLSVRAYSGVSVSALTRVDRAATGSTGVLAEIDAVAGTTYRIVVDSGRAVGRFDLRLIQTVASSSSPLGEGEYVTAPSSSSGAQSASRRGVASAPFLSEFGAAIRAAVSGRRPAGTVFRWTTGPRGVITLRWTAPPGTSGRLSVALTRLSRRAVTVSVLGLAARPARPARPARSVVLDVRAGEHYAVTVRGHDAYFGLAIHPLAGFRFDLTPPVIHCAVPRGWHHHNIDVVCHAADSGSGLYHPADARFVLATSIPSQTATADAGTGSLTVCDRAGNCADAGPFTGLKVDRSAPVVTCAPVAATRWEPEVIVACSAYDPPGGSGLAHAVDRSFRLTAVLPRGHSGTSVAFDRHPPVCDVAGNCTAVPSPGRVKIDDVAPAVHCSVPSRRRWIRTLSIACRASDRLVGLADPGDSAFTLAPAAGSRMIARHEVCNTIGVCAVVGPFGPFRIDDLAPRVLCAVPTGWVRGSRLTVSCRATDTLSGVAGARRFRLRAVIGVGREGVAHTGSRRVCDHAGNCVAVEPFAVKLDDSAPHVSCPTVPLGPFYEPVSLRCSVIDYGSGVRGGVDAVTVVARGIPGRLDRRARFTRVRVCDNVGNCTLTPALRAVTINRRRA